MRYLLLLICTLCYSTQACAAPTIRDPFSLPEQKKKPVSKEPINLEGIVYSGQKRSAAVLISGQERQVVQRGERFQGYQLIMIGKDFVVLARGKKKQKLCIK